MAAKGLTTRPAQKTRKTAKKRGRGRPATGKSPRISVRIPPADGSGIEMIDRAAAAAGMDRTDWVVKTLLAAAGAK